MGIIDLTTQYTKWDLSELFENLTDPKINQTIKKISSMANKFEENYRGNLTKLNIHDLLQSFKSLEKFKAKFNDLVLYSRLSFFVDMVLTETQSLYDRINKLESKIGKQLAFYSLELGDLLKQKPQIIREPDLRNYSHMLERVYRSAMHQLSEIEEQLIIEKDQFGIDAWQELQSKWLNTRLFEINVLGKKRILSYGKANGLLSHFDRDTRESANKSIYGLLAKDGEIFASALRSICNDWISVCNRRKYTSPMESSLISNDTDQDIVDNLIKAIDKSSEIYRSYLKIKAKIMGLTKLGNHDIIVPLPNLKKHKFTYRQAKNLIIKAYSAFDKEYTEAVKEMFSKKHIDAEPRFGKRNGAFCASYYNGKSAYILSNFNGTLSDVYTLAHELGHATHDWYASRNQTLLNMNIPSVVAEIASIFGELLLTDLLIEEAKSEDEKKLVLSSVLDGAGMTTFQVTARIWFEQSLYQSIKKDEFLDYATICNKWMNARDRIYRDVVSWFPEMESEWSIKPHYFMANYRFYNYPYVYAQMFVYSLYEQYLVEGKDFVHKMKKALSVGSSISPLKIAEIFNFNIKSPNFWNNGIKMFESFFINLKKII
jgi:oligoendopeptidase F